MIAGQECSRRSVLVYVRTAWRECLGYCGKKFRSRGPENRICPICAEKQRHVGDLPRIRSLERVFD